MKSVGTADNLKKIIDRQRDVLSALEAEYKILDNSDLVKENAALKTELEKLRKEYVRTNQKAGTLSDENARLKNALYLQIFNERLKLINATEQKLDAYFRSNISSELSKTAALEKNVKMRIDNIKNTLVQQNIDAKDDIYSKLDELSELLVFC